MPKLKQIRRVVMFVDTALEKMLLEEFMKLGVKGYNCTYGFGRGRHGGDRGGHEGEVDDAHSGYSRVRIEMLTGEEVAHKVLDYIRSDTLQRYPITAYTDLVEVDTRDTRF